MGQSFIQWESDLPWKCICSLENFVRLGVDTPYSFKIFQFIRKILLP